MTYVLRQGGREYPIRMWPSGDMILVQCEGTPVMTQGYNETDALEMIQDAMQLTYDSPATIHEAPHAF